MTQIAPPPDLGTQLYLLTIRGVFKPPTLEQARGIHNMTAGADASMNASRALGDLSHNVFVRVDEKPKQGAGEVLFVDLWNSIAGLQQFFSDPQVQQGGSMIFADREPTVWKDAEGFPRIELLAPKAKPERYLGTLRVNVTSMKDARETIERMTAKGINTSRRYGHLARSYYVRADGGDGAELLGVDTWTSLAGAGEFYSKLEDFASLGKIFAGKPQTAIWGQPEGEWTEW